MPQTPIYGFPYQGANDPPHGPDLGRLLAEALETKIAAMDAATAALPRGIVKWAQRLTATPTTTAADLGVLRLDGISLLTARQYRIWTPPLHMDSTSVNDEVRARLRYSLAGAATIASTVLPGATVHTRQTDANVSEDKSISTLYTPAGNETMSIILCVGRIAGAGNVSLNNTDADQTIQIVVEDIGPAQAQSGVVL
ncbi:hypothetical protein K1W54_28795 [Micromonospora sp. CPCC 205371]|nr:hypothetical protein [Micromonospora sp. CPCC 205371]